MIQAIEMCSQVSTTTMTYSAIVASAAPAPIRVRNWTGKPKGKTPEQQIENIRKRKSYQHIVDEAKRFRDKGIDIEHIPFILNYIISLKSDYRLFPYRGRGHYYKQCFEVFCKDIKNYDKRQELGL